MRTKTIAIVAVMVMMLSASSILLTENDVSADDSKISVEDDNGFKYYLLEDGTLKLRSVPMDTLEVDLTDVRVSGVKYIVTEIQFSTFFRQSDLTKAIMPDVKVIEEMAFTECVALNIVEMPSVEKIEENAFEYCTSLETVEMLNAVSIGAGAFQSCTILNSVTFSDKLNEIGGGAFSNTSLNTVNSLPSPFEFTDGMISNGGTLISFTNGADCVIPDDITEIAEYAFIGCDKLETVEMSSIQIVGDGAFRECSALKAAGLPNAHTIGNTAFLGCSSLKTAELMDARTIGGGAFNACVVLDSVSIPNVQTIGNNAFYGCTSLTDLTLPDSLITIGAGAFNNTGITELSNLPNGYEIKDNVMIQDGKRVIGCLAGATHLISDTITEVKREAFEFNTELKTVDLPNLTTIETCSFYDCTALESVIMPNIQTVSSFAFSGCTSLESVIMPNVQTIGMSAFRWCTSLKDVTLPNVQTIDISAFSGCTSLESVIMPNVQTVEYGAFAGCSSLTEVTASADVVGAIAVMDGVDLKKVFLTDLSPEGLDISVFDGMEMYYHVSDQQWIDNEYDAQPFAYVSYYDGKQLLKRESVPCSSSITMEKIEGYDNEGWYDKYGNEFVFPYMVNDDVDMFTSLPDNTVSSKGYSGTVLMAVIIVSVIGMIGIAIFRD